MSAISVEVVSKAATTKVGGAPLAVTLVLVSERITVRELVRRTVLEQIRELRERQQRSEDEITETLKRQYMTEGEIASAAQWGAVRFPRAPRSDEVDVEAETRRALRGFECGAFRVIVNGEMFAELDHELTLQPQGKVIFLRLIPLVGG